MSQQFHTDTHNKGICHTGTTPCETHDLDTTRGLVKSTIIVLSRQKYLIAIFAIV